MDPYKRAQKIFLSFKRSVVYVATTDSRGDDSIGTAFHIGNGHFVTARHVVENMKIKTVSHERPSLFCRPLTVRHVYYHPDEETDVAILATEGVRDDLPSVHLGGHLDDMIEDGLTLSPVLVMGYPPIPLTKEPLLVACLGHVNADIDKYCAPHAHFLVSTVARGGFSGGLAFSLYGFALGVVTESLVHNGEPCQIGFNAVLSVEPILEALGHHGILPAADRELWGELFDPGVDDEKDF